MSATATNDLFPAETAARARRYARAKRRINLIGWALSGAVLVVLLETGWTRDLRNVANGVFRPPGAALIVYLLLLAALFELFRLPLAFYSSYVIEHRFGLSRASLRVWLKDRLKVRVLGAALGLATAELFYYALRRDPRWWWLWVAAAFILFGLLMARLAPVVLFPLFFKFRPLENEDLVNRLKALCERAGTRVASVQEWKLSEKSSKSNAALAGWGSTRRIILADTLLERHSPEEIESILAHELGHHVHRDIGKGVLAEAGLALATLYLIDRVLRWTTPWFGFAGVADFANLPLVLLVATLFSALVLPAANLFSRRREREADAFALRATRNREAFIGAMRKLAEQNLAEVKPHPLIEFLFYTHPPISKRISFAEKVQL